MGFASFSILIWDHIDTLADEVEFIWFGKKSAMTYFFLVNRYLTPLGFIVNLFAYLSPVWTPEVFVILASLHAPAPDAPSYTGISIVAIMMFFRIRALYYAQQWIVGSVAGFFLVMTGIHAYLLTRGEAVIHNPDSGVKACTMIFDPEISILASSSAWLPLLYDTIVLVLTLYRTIPSFRHRTASYVVKRLLEDGLVYYGVIFAVTLVLTIMIIAAPPGLKNITAQLELLITVAMMSRITINLKKSVRKVLVEDLGGRQEPQIMFTRRTQVTIDQGVQLQTIGYGRPSRHGPMDHLYGINTGNGPQSPTFGNAEAIETPFAVSDDEDSKGVSPKHGTGPVNVDIPKRTKKDDV
ncbi:hypothetical protein AX16_008482 [Volvariella volvacea WC 439]|nr:hypothetical protein AX16_008482 [Volvariella volvacea WC 439]